MTIDPPSQILEPYQPIHLTLGAHGRESREGGAEPPAPCALHVLLSHDDQWAKVGYLYTAANGPQRLRDIALHWSGDSDPGELPYRMAVVADLDGLVIDKAQDKNWYRTQLLVEALESAVRMVIARDCGRLAPFYEWIDLDGVRRADRWWADQMVAAWGEASSLAERW